jgi:hypothetical protein
VKIHPADQGSLDWLMARAGLITASEFDSIVTPEFKPRTGETVQTYLATKLAERWIQGPLAGFSAFATEQGNILEDEAKPWYSLEYGEEIIRVGLCTSDDGRIGCSPDGLLGKEGDIKGRGGIEIKCPEPTAHVKYLLADELPKQYRAQVHGSMLVTGRPWWKFLSYRRGFPKLLLTVNRDTDIEHKLQQAIEEFLVLFEAGWQKLCERNGGPPPKRKVFVPSPESADNPYVEVGITP